MPGWKEFSTGFWDPDEEEHLGVQAKPLEPKPISEEEPAHVIHIDHAEEGGEDAANFAKVSAMPEKYLTHFRKRSL